MDLFECIEKVKDCINLLDGAYVEFEITYDVILDFAICMARFSKEQIMKATEYWIENNLFYPDTMRLFEIALKFENGEME